MKKESLALFFYFLYVMAMFRPLLPVLEYRAHHKYIVAVLCENRARPALACNGKCYLKKQLQKQVKTPASKDHPSPQKDGAQIDLSKYPVTPISGTYFSYLSEENPTETYWNTLVGDVNACIVDLLRPPIPFTPHV